MKKLKEFWRENGSSVLLFLMAMLFMVGWAMMLYGGMVAQKS